MNAPELSIREMLACGRLLPMSEPWTWADKPTPERLWLIEGWLPYFNAALLTGDGATGKSLLGQQMATCVAMGVPMLGAAVRPVRALYVTCEDDVGELHRRQKAIP